MIGDRLRTLRHQRGLTLRQVAQSTGLSAGLLSQIENGHTDPSVTTLRKLAQVFDADLASLFHEPDAPAVYISKPGGRFRMTAPDGLVTYERITPGRGDLEVLRAELAPGDASSEEPWGHPSTECVYVLQGTVCLEIDGRTERIAADESVTFDSRQPHRYVNDTDATAAILVVVSPPTP